MSEAECFDLERTEPENQRRRIGVPVQEGLLTAGFLQRVYGAKRPGLGRSTYVLLEPQLGAGRPDVVLLTISPSALEWFRRSDLRLPSPLAARAADPRSDITSLGVSKSHALAVRRNLERQGWLDADFARISNIISESVAIEAKMRDWKSAIRQVAKFRGLFSQSAILMPRRPLPDAAFTALAYYDCGLLFLKTTSSSGSGDRSSAKLPLGHACGYWSCYYADLRRVQATDPSRREKLQALLGS